MAVPPTQVSVTAAGLTLRPPLSNRVKMTRTREWMNDGFIAGAQHRLNAQNQTPVGHRPAPDHFDSSHEPAHRRVRPAFLPARRKR